LTPLDFNGRAAMVTGGGSGIGEACARRLAERGATVLIVDRDGEDGARVRAEIVAAGGGADLFVGDLTDPDT
jgi:3-hydroxybutyrate dehydrogenase